jgi:hypothetical protein
MGRLLTLITLPLFAVAALVYCFPETKPAKKVEQLVEDVAHAFSPQEASQVELPAESLAPYERLAAASVTVGPEVAQQPEVRIWAIRNDRNYGWIQLPRGTQVYFLRNDGEYVIVRYQETVIRAHRNVIDAGMLIPKKTRTFAVAY